MRTRLAVILAITVAATAASASSAWAGTSAFRSPTGNILCTIVGYSQVGCAVVSRRQAVNVSRNGSARYVAYNPTNRRRFTLDYGQFQEYQGFRCISRTSGVTCESLRTGRGFRVSRGSITRF